MDNQTIPYFVHEGDMARTERTIKRLWILCIILIVLFIGSNALWIYYESQYENVVETTQDVIQTNADGVNNFVGGNGVIGYGDAESDN